MALERHPPPQFDSHLNLLAAPTVFRVRGEGPSSGCVASQQKDYILLGGVACNLTNALALAIALAPFTMAMYLAHMGAVGHT